MCEDITIIVSRVADMMAIRMRKMSKLKYPLRYLLMIKVPDVMAIRTREMAKLKDPLRYLLMIRECRQIADPTASCQFALRGHSAIAPQQYAAVNPMTCQASIRLCPGKGRQSESHGHDGDQDEGDV